VDKGAISIIRASECKRAVLTRMSMKINISLKRLLLRNALHECLCAVHHWVAESVQGMPDSVQIISIQRTTIEPFHHSVDADHRHDYEKKMVHEISRDRTTGQQIINEPFQYN
jgi:hypothetical protein